MNINVIEAFYLIDIIDAYKDYYGCGMRVYPPRPGLKIPSNYEILSKKIYKDVLDGRLAERGFTPAERAEIESFFHSDKVDLIKKIAIFSMLEQKGRDYYEEFAQCVKYKFYDYM